MDSSRSTLALIQNGVLIFLAGLITTVIFLLDLKTENTVAVAGIYAVVILYSWILPGKFTSLYAAAVCSILTILSAVQSRDYSVTVGDLSGLNFVISLVVIWTSVTLVSIAKSSFTSLESINKQLSESSKTLLEKLKELDIQQEKLSSNKAQLEKLNENLLIKNRELERFTSIASHDLQEPLRTIGNMTELISKRYSTNFDEQGKIILDYVSSATLRMTSLIKGLLEFSRIGNKREINSVDCQELVKIILLDFNSAIQASKGSVKIKSLPTIMGNAIELRMLFQNLIGNGLKFIKDGVTPELEISAIEYHTHVEFCVKDNGIGIAEEDFEKIFLIFQRLHPTELYTGSGLGLAYCRKIVELHGGKIWVNSTRDLGSSFYFTLLKPV